MIALDAMGGDYAPRINVEGAILSARKGVSVMLFGDEQELTRLLDECDRSWRYLPLSIIHCSQAIAMGDEPGRMVMDLQDSSLVKAVTAVKTGKAQAIVSAGNSGAALVAGMFILEKIPGILRPAIGGFLPTRKGSVFCMDLGATTDPKPEFLRQYGVMGHAYVRLTKGIQDPKIGLLANGTEMGKGNRLVQQAYALLEQSPLRFIGNCEPGDILNDVADVVVCEGFAGNIMLKAMEATVHVVTQWLKDEGNKTLLGQCVGFFGGPIFRRLKKNIKKAQRGGALLLGLKKPLVIAHGSADGQTMHEAIMFAHAVVTQNFYAAYLEEVERLLMHTTISLQQSRQKTVGA